MCYYSLNDMANSMGRGAMSKLTDFLEHRRKWLKMRPAEVADKAEISRSSYSYIIKKGKTGEVRPEPDTIRALAKALEVPPPLLTALMGYPTEPITDIDERLYELARQLLGAPWLADRISDFLRLPRSEFDELMRYLDYRLPHPDADQSKP